MKLLVKITKDITLQAEGKAKEVFALIAEAQATFADEQCGLCGHADLQYRVREEGGYEFYELSCPKCYAKLCYGSSQDDKGRIYPKRYKTHKEGKDKGKAIRDDDGKAIPHGKKGWTKFNRETGEEE